MRIWTEKYTPTTLKEVIGDRPPLLKLQDFILNYRRHNKNSMLIHGPPGTGKSSCIYAIAKENNLDILELSSSEFRNKKNIELVLGDSINQSSLLKSGRIILIDDIDGISGRKDRGAPQALVSIIKKSSFPIVMTSNNPWESKFSKLRNKSFMVEFKSLSYIEIFNFLKVICQKEDISFDEKCLKRIAIENEGDLRSSINDLQSVCSGVKDLNEDSIGVLGYREKEESIFNLLQLIFRSKDIESILEYIDRVDLSLDEVLLWVEENIATEYTPEETNHAFENLAKADVFRGRIRRNQYWRFLVYQKILMGPAIALSKKSKKKSFTKYSKPQRILKIWKNKMKYSKRENISHKLKSYVHASSRKTMKHFLPYLKIISKNENHIKELGLDNEDIIGLTY